MTKKLVTTLKSYIKSLKIWKKKEQKREKGKKRDESLIQYKLHVFQLLCLTDETNTVE